MHHLCASIKLCRFDGQCFSIRRRKNGIVVGECFEFFEIFAVRNPRIADFFAQKVGETGVCRDHPTTRRDAVRLVVEALGEELDEIGEEVGFDEVGVDLCIVISQIVISLGIVGRGILWQLFCLRR